MGSSSSFVVADKLSAGAAAFAVAVWFSVSPPEQAERNASAEAAAAIVRTDLMSGLLERVGMWGSRVVGHLEAFAAGRRRL
jgi:tryptophan synthase alpha subunit